ncbi:MAG: N-acetylmuramic acid 6-phosphate etherase [Candidatus Brocadiales bacterium]
MAPLRKSQRSNRSGTATRGADRSHLLTERRNHRTKDIDTKDILEIVDIINKEDTKVSAAVRKERKNIARAVKLIVKSFKNGGRLFYVGAGTSGRLGILDASEMPPTFGTQPGLVQGIIAGGRKAVFRSVEGAEDSRSDAAEAIRRAGVRNRDTVVGIAAGGTTPFVQSAVKTAGKIGAGTVFLTCNPETRPETAVDVIIRPVTGPEVITGSTRMKAGTATKLVLNTLTTAAMIRTGRVYGNLMVDLRATNNKLIDRSERIIMELTGLSRRAAKGLLEKAHGETKTAIVMHLLETSYTDTRKRLSLYGGSLRGTLESYS